MTSVPLTLAQLEHGKARLDHARGHLFESVPPEDSGELLDEFLLIGSVLDLIEAETNVAYNRTFPPRAPVVLTFLGDPAW